MLLEIITRVYYAKQYLLSCIFCFTFSIVSLGSDDLVSRGARKRINRMEALTYIESNSLFRGVRSYRCVLGTGIGIHTTSQCLYKYLHFIK